METTSSNILDISSPMHPNVFEGDVVALYVPTCNKNSNSPNKVELTHANLVDKDGQLIVTINISNALVSRFMKYFTPGRSVQISNFIARNKGIYERADAKQCIVPHQQTTLETIPQAYQQHKLAANTMIHALNLYKFLLR